MKLSDLDILQVGHTIQIAGAVFADSNALYLCLLPDEGAEGRRIETLDMDADDWARFIRQTDLLEAEVLAKAKDGTLAKVILRKSTRQIEQGVSWTVYRRDGFQCRYCGADNVPLTVDHLVLWEEGGPSIPTNLLTACRRCNRARGNMGYEDWLKSPYYLQVSRKLPLGIRADNEALVKALDTIPRQHVRSR